MNTIQQNIEAIPQIVATIKGDILSFQNNAKEVLNVHIEKDYTDGQLNRDADGRMQAFKELARIAIKYNMDLSHIKLTTGNYGHRLGLNAQISVSDGEPIYIKPEFLCAVIHKKAFDNNLIDEDEYYDALAMGAYNYISNLQTDEIVGLVEQYIQNHVIWDESPLALNYEEIIIKSIKAGTFESYEAGRNHEGVWVNFPVGQFYLPTVNDIKNELIAGDVCAPCFHVVADDGETLLRVYTKTVNILAEDSVDDEKLIKVAI